MRCNINCELIKKGKSTATLWIGDENYKHCVYRHKLMLKRGDYARTVIIGGDVTSTYCYRGKIVRKVKPRTNQYNDAMVI
jgi:hypothetical protein